MRSRITPSLLVAVLALVLAAGGTGYAAGKITSQQIKDGTIQSRDIKDGAVTSKDIKNSTIEGADLKYRSIPRTKLDRRCVTGEVAVFGGCVRRQAYARSSHQAAVDDCNRRNGRLPSVAETRWIATHDEFVWADGNVSNYEFTGDYTTTFPVTPIGLDAGGNVVPNASAQLFWHHCITY